MKIGNREFQTKGHTYVMGILNVTPDSFSDGGKWNDLSLIHISRQLLKPPCTERYARWCERTGANHSLLLDLSAVTMRWARKKC